MATFLDRKHFFWKNVLNTHHICSYLQILVQTKSQEPICTALAVSVTIKSKRNLYVYTSAPFAVGNRL
jgi:hypothetical protein